MAQMITRDDRCRFAVNDATTFTRMLDAIEARYDNALARGNYELSYRHHLSDRFEIMVRTHRDWYTDCDYFRLMVDAVGLTRMTLIITVFEPTEHRRQPLPMEINDIGY
ncbi:hypothetical protein Tco_1544018 [Tanacetum coccineum]